MKNNIGRVALKIKRLWKKLGSRAALAAEMSVTEQSIRNWETGGNIYPANLRELERFFIKHEIK